MAREKCYYVYIMASKSRVIYVGMTGFLMARVLRHRAGEGGEFTRKYRVHRPDPAPHVAVFRGQDHDHGNQFAFRNRDRRLVSPHWGGV